MDLKHSEDYHIKVLLNKVKLKEIMTRAIHSINMDEPFSSVEEKFRTLHIRHLPVVDRHYKVVGIVTQRDLYKIHSPRKREDGDWYYEKKDLDRFILKYVMTKNPKVLHPESTAADAVMLMVKGKYGCIPIVDDSGLLCGIITQVDILKIAAQILEET